MLISYAQNFEDVILWRALKHVDAGFYIDIGAQDPVGDSVSLAFYEHGWRGVHVEPMASYAEKLRAARPDEEVIEAAIGAAKGKITLFEIPDTGLSTADEAVAVRHEAKGWSVQRAEVEVLPLSTLLDRHLERDIHWLKIDVEGMEEAVIDGWPPSKARPWVVVVESTIPNSPEQSHMSWEPKLLKLGYDFVYFDGLNRFYVSHEHPELEASFGPGPNVFDDAVLSGLASAPFCRKVNEEAAEIGRRLAAAEAELSARKSEIAQLEGEVSALRQSTSWRVTAPMRAISRMLRWLMRGPRWFARGVWAWSPLKPGSRPRRAARAALLRLARFVLARPRLKRFATSCLRRYPGTYARLRMFVIGQGGGCTNVAAPVARLQSTGWSPNGHQKDASESHGEYQDTGAIAAETQESGKDNADWIGKEFRKRSIDEVLLHIRNELSAANGGRQDDAR